jgi:hypothetical protein
MSLPHDKPDNLSPPRIRLDLDLRGKVYVDGEEFRMHISELARQSEEMEQLEQRRRDLVIDAENEANRGSGFTPQLKAMSAHHRRKYNESLDKAKAAYTFAKTPSFTATIRSSAQWIDAHVPAHDTGEKRRRRSLLCRHCGSSRSMSPTPWHFSPLKRPSSSPPQYFPWTGFSSLFDHAGSRRVGVDPSATSSALLNSLEFRSLTCVASVIRVA